MNIQDKIINNILHMKACGKSLNMIAVANNLTIGKVTTIINEYQALGNMRIQEVTPKRMNPDNI